MSFAMCSGSASVFAAGPFFAFAVAQQGRPIMSKLDSEIRLQCERETGDQQLAEERRVQGAKWLEDVSVEIQKSQLAREIGMVAEFNGSSLSVRSPEFLQIGWLSAKEGEAYWSTEMYKGAGIGQCEPRTFADYESLVTFVASPLSSATNGAALRVDGGVVRSIV